MDDAYKHVSAEVSLITDAFKKKFFFTSKCHYGKKQMLVGGLLSHSHKDFAKFFG